MEFLKSIGPIIDVGLTLEFAKFKILVELLNTLPSGTEQRAGWEEIGVHVRKQVKRPTAHTWPVVELVHVGGNRVRAVDNSALVLRKLSASTPLQVDCLGTGQEPCLVPIVAGEEACGDERLFGHDAAALEGGLPKHDVSKCSFGTKTVPYIFSNACYPVYLHRQSDHVSIVFLNYTLHSRNRSKEFLIAVFKLYRYTENKPNTLIKRTI